jgi:hypothetical protein
VQGSLVGEASFADERGGVRGPKPRRKRVEAGQRDAHVVTSATPWWWNPPGLEDGEWGEWLHAVQGMDPLQRAHRLASAAASRLYHGVRIVEVRCRDHAQLIAEVRATPHGPLWHSVLVGDSSRGPVIRRVDLLGFNGFVPTLLAWCRDHGRTKTLDFAMICDIVEVALRSDRLEIFNA